MMYGNVCRMSIFCSCEKIYFLFDIAQNKKIVLFLLSV